MDSPAQTLISPENLLEHLDDPDWAIVDCRFYLAEPERGELEYLQAHVPGAVYAHLDQHLSAQVIPGATGRHPLPKPEETVEVFSDFGIDSGVHVVAYDDAGGGLAAARLWWMLRWLGHLHAAVLDGGWQGWVKRGFPTRQGRETRRRRIFEAHLRPELVVDAAEVNQTRLMEPARVVDVRAAERYRGEVEPIDPVAGHIPGAVNAPYLDNLDSEGNFLPAETLRERYRRLLGESPVEEAIFYCGSGVTAAQGVLAVVHAGLGEPRLYAGSWSEWITEPRRLVQKG
jgi:thiosulfate/3-mercaptopyruvate sulfurtransferase